MSGLLVFRSLDEAIRAGFQVYDRVSDGYLVKARTATGWALALVKLSEKPEFREVQDSVHVHHVADPDAEC